MPLTVFFLALSMPGFTQAQDQKLILGIASFDDSELPLELGNIATLIPQQLLKKVYFFKKMEMSSDSLRIIAEKKEAQEEKKIREKISSIQRKRDAIFFESSGASQRNFALKLKEAEIKKELKTLETLNRNIAIES